MSLSKNLLNSADNHEGKSEPFQVTVTQPAKVTPFAGGRRSDV
jgi:hypothetical protein